MGLPRSAFNLLVRLVRKIIDEIAELVKDMSNDPLVQRALEADLGLPPGSLDKAKGKPLPDSSGIDQYISAVDPDAEKLAVTFEFIKTYFKFWTDIFAAAKEEDPSLVVDTLVYRLVQLSTVNLVKFDHPTIYYVMRFIGIITQDVRLSVEESFFPQQVTNIFTSEYWRNAGDRFKEGYLVFRLDQAADLFLAEPDPAHPLTREQIIERNQLGFRIFGFSDLFFNVESVLLMVLQKYLFRSRGLESDEFYGWELPPGPNIPLSERIASRALTLRVSSKEGASDSSSILLTQLFQADENDRLGWLFSLRGAVSFETIIDEDTRPLKLKITFDTPDGLDAVIHFTGEDKFEFGGLPTAGVKISIEPVQSAVQLPAFSLPEVTGTRLEIGDFSFKIELNTDGFKFNVKVEKSALLIVPSEGDSFVAESLKSKDVRIDFQLGITADTRNGIHLDGGSRLSTTIPVNKSVAGVHLQTITLAVSPSSNPNSSEVALITAASLTFSLGPLLLTMEQIGMSLNVGVAGETIPPGSTFLLPFLYLRDFGFRSPSGVGILVDSDKLTGGGFLFFDRDNGQYAGALQLEFELFGRKLSLKALGLISTRLPDGSKGFSLLIILSIEFNPPFRIGPLAFMGIGGLVGINRTLDAEVLRTGLKNHALDAILFPKDPVANAARYINILRGVFPPVRGHHLIGFSILLGWGTPTLITAELGVIYEFGESHRLILIGQIHMALPRQTAKKVLEIHMDALGIWDYDKREFSLDAHLYDSHLAFIQISGDMALRMREGSDGYFLLSIGGYHPKFNVPANFPKLERVTIKFADSKHLRMILSGYVAISTNTRQAGGKLDFLVSFGGFSIEGFIQIDVLWEPDVRFIADYDIKLALKYHGRTLLGAHAVGQFFGPEPKRLKGEVSIDLFLFSISKSYDFISGDDRPPQALPPIDPLPELVAALADPRSWETQLPGRSNMLVSLRSQPSANQVLVHPLGELSVRQQVLPLGVRIDRFAGGVPSGERTFTITHVTLGGDPLDDPHPITEFFAPADFLDLSDDEKLARPSFEPMPAGFALQSSGLSFGGEAPGTGNQAVASVIDFEDVIVDADGNLVEETPPPGPIRGDVLVAVLSFSAAGLSPLRASGSERFGSRGSEIQVSSTTFVAAGVDDLQAADIGVSTTAGQSYTMVQQALETHLQANPGSKGKLQIIDSYQAEATP